MGQIFILTGRSGTGKTTFLFSALNADRGAFTGVLAPLKNNLRYLYLINEHKYIQLEYPAGKIPPEPVYKIGRYSFLQSAFMNVNYALQSINTNHKEIFILDEIGPLEIERKGFYPAIESIFLKKRNINFNSLLVIREKLLDDVINLFNFNPSKIFTLTDLLNRDMSDLIGRPAD